MEVFFKKIQSVGTSKIVKIQTKLIYQNTYNGINAIYRGHNILIVNYLKCFF